MRGKYFDDPFCSNEGFKGNDGCFALPPLPVEVHAMAKFLRTVAAFLASPTSLVGLVIKSSREALAFHCGICRCHAQPNICGLESDVVTYKTWKSLNSDDSSAFCIDAKLMRSLDDPSHDAVTSVCVRLIIDASPVVGGILGDLRPFLDICSQTQSHWVSPQISMLVPNAGLATDAARHL